MQENKITTIHTLPKQQAQNILTQISRIEKKSFPTNEAYQFTQDLWKKKSNTQVLYAYTTSNETKDVIVTAYAVYVRQKGTALLHKICVAQPYRRKGLGIQLMDYIRQRLEREGCQYIQLWVDKDRCPARSLYLHCGFVECEEVVDYYSPGRSGIRMVLSLDLAG